MKIKNLTDDQKNQIQIYQKKWVEIGLNTNRFSNDEATKLANDFYEIVLKKKKPKAVVVMDSPVSAWLATVLLANYNQIGNKVDDQVVSQVWAQVGDQVRAQVMSQVGNQVWDKVRNQVWNQVWNQVRNQVWDQVEDQVVSQVWDQVVSQVWAQVISQVGNQVWDKVRNQVWNQVWNQVRNQVRNQVWDQVEDQVVSQVWAQVGDQVRAQVISQVGNQVWDQVGSQVLDKVWAQVGAQFKNFIWPYYNGSFDSGWISFYDFFNEVLHIEYKKQKEFDVIRNCTKLGIVYPLDDFCIVSQKPSVIINDEMNRLHNYDGAALSYSDGFSVYAFHGVRIPEKYAITPANQINIDDVLKENSSEVRMAVLGKIGLANALGKIPHKIISSYNKNDLIEFKIENEFVRGLVVRWTDMFSDKVTVLPVPKTIEEFKEAFCDSEFPDDFPDDVNDCEQVRLSTFRGFIHQAKQESKLNGKHWMECIEWVQET